MTLAGRWHLFDAVGVEIEYMIVDADSLDVRPIADQLFASALGKPGSDVEGDVVSWSNELVAHVVELKTTEPVGSIAEACSAFRGELARVEELLSPMGARLLPTAMHPWMNPALETVLWPLDNREVYESFDRIFSCRGHGWSNLQSMHLNLPFVGDDEFARLHSAIRLVLPMIPGLSASSPFEEGRATGWLDNRMKHYFNNSASIPEVAGEIVPEPVRSEEEYRERIFEPMFRAIAPYDTDGVLQEEWLNARGAIARFERGSIEIRVIDTQESVTADLAIAELVVWAVRSLVEERWSTTAEQLCCSQATLVELLRDAVRVGPEARVQDAALLECLGLPITISRLGDIWSALLKAARSSGGISERSASPLDVLLVEGALASRILRGAETTAAGLRGTYRHLADCLQRDEMYRAY